MTKVKRTNHAPCEITRRQTRRRGGTVVINVKCVTMSPTLMESKAAREKELQGMDSQIETRPEDTALCS